MAAYDHIGTTYASTRQPDPRIAARIRAALGRAASVINVGAGTGSYEPPNRMVVAAEPSRVMLMQRPAGSATAVQAAAEQLPFADRSFDAAMAILTVHHWNDVRQGMAELRRVARDSIVVLTSDTHVWESFWLVSDYFPAIGRLDHDRVPWIDDLAAALGQPTVLTVPIPHDCRDGFTGAFWRRPAAYLDPSVRAGMSSFALIDDKALAEGLRRLQQDLATGAWDERYSDLLEHEEVDLGYRLLVSQP